MATVVKNAEFEAKHHRGAHGRFGPGTAKPKLLKRDERAVAAIAGTFHAHPIPSREHAAAYTGGQPRRIRPETVGAFHELAGKLRRRDVSDERVKRLDEAMAPTAHDLVLTRHVPASAFGLNDADLHRLPELLAGRKIVDRAYTPAALHQTDDQAGGVTLHIAAPAGTRALVAGDNEMWLDRDLELAVGGVYPNGRGGYTVELTALPKAQNTPAKKATKAAKKATKAAKATGAEAAPAKRTTKRAPRTEAPTPAARPNREQFNERIAKAHKEADALYVAPVAYQDGKQVTPPPGVRWNRAQRTRYARAFEAYQSDLYEPINTALRAGRGQYGRGDARVAEAIDGLDEALQHSHTEADAVVYRGIRDAGHLFSGVDVNGDVSGLEWVEHGFASTTADPVVARDFAIYSTGEGDNIVMRMLVPKGTPAAQLSEYVGHSAEVDEGLIDKAEEAELMLKRGLRFRVVADHGISDEDGLRHWDVEVIADERPGEAEAGAEPHGASTGSGSGGAGGGGGASTGSPTGPEGAGASPGAAPAVKAVAKKAATAKKATPAKKAAVKKAAKKTAAPAAEPGFPSRSVSQLDDLMKRARKGESVQAELAKGIEGQYGGLNVTVAHVESSRAGEIYVAGEIHAPGDAKRVVGQFERTFRNDRGKLVAVHETLMLDRAQQGSGFAREFNANLFDWYRRSGFDRVETHANIDVGGYTWATQGFDFENDQALADWLSGARGRLDRYRGIISPQTYGGVVVRDMRQELIDSFNGMSVDEIDVQLRQMHDLVSEAEKGRPVSAYEFSQVGRKAGQGRNDMWIGKALMLNSHWMGALRL